MSGNPAHVVAWATLNTQIVGCERCPRLRTHCQSIAAEKRRAFLDWEYWGRPVSNFGDPAAWLLIVGLAPAAHGANRTGRMFTGDRSGEWLYRALHKAGLANQPNSANRDDGLTLRGCAITAVCHCAPPDNKPEPAEILACQPWLNATVDLLPVCVIVALGQIAWKATLELAQARGWQIGDGTSKARPKFGHGVVVKLGDKWLIGSYHPSQQNTFTGRLTESMLDAVFAAAHERHSALRDSAYSSPPT